MMEPTIPATNNTTSRGSIVFQANYHSTKVFFAYFGASP